jgi:epoxyqueuosine reductase
MTLAAARLREHALELGFNLVGITRAQSSPTLAAYFRWIERGMHGTMGYMARPDRQSRRRDLNVILPGAQSLVIVGLDYGSAVVPADILSDPTRGRIASYAWNLDYHDLMQPRLEQLATWLQSTYRAEIQHKVYVDTGAILERSHAQQAGLGFSGKNTMLIHPRRGSRFFLGEIILTAEFDEYDVPHQATMCGNCTRCLNACPTDAFPEPYVLDARRCISYLTIEHYGWIDRDLRPLMGNWVYGCDVCQDVCPFQRFAAVTREADFLPADLEAAAPLLTDLLALDDRAFKARFQGSPIARIKRDRLVRNACIAAGNGRVESALPELQRLLNDASPLVRGHAAWSLAQFALPEYTTLLERCYDRENDPQVRVELAHVLGEK